MQQEPDQIDMMSESELRAELRRLVKENRELSYDLIKSRVRENRFVRALTYITEGDNEHEHLVDVLED